MRSFMPAAAMTVASIAFQIALANGHFKQYDRAVPYLYAVSGVLWLVVIVLAVVRKLHSKQVPLGVRRRAFSDARISEFNSKHSVGRSLYLVQRQAVGFDVYTGRIVEVRSTIPHDARDFMPQYYFQQEQFVFSMRTWIRLSSLRRVESSELDRLTVVSSGIPVANVLERGMASVMAVRA